jgi:hypothetical protein
MSRGPAFQGLLAVCVPSVFCDDSVTRRFPARYFRSPESNLLKVDSDLQCTSVIPNNIEHAWGWFMDTPLVMAGEDMLKKPWTLGQGLFLGSFDQVPGPEQMRAIHWAIVFYRSLPNTDQV